MLPRKLYDLPLADGRKLRLGTRTLVMGIINVTPDSFADGGAHFDPERVLDAALALEEAGADLLDVGGESTRPGAKPLPVDEERGRVLPVLDRLVSRVHIPISVDTYKAEVAREAVVRGAAMINDVSSLRYDLDLARVVAAAGVPLVLMHNRGRSEEMYRRANYADVIGEITSELAVTIDRALTAGVAREQIIVDPGLGFSKRASETFTALAKLDALGSLERPVLVGPSRKSFLQDSIGQRPPNEREWGTAAAVTAAVLLGAHVVRVHGVREMVEVIRVADRLRAERDTTPVVMESTRH